MNHHFEVGQKAVVVGSSKGMKCPEYIGEIVTIQTSLAPFSHYGLPSYPCVGCEGIWRIA